VDVDDVADQLYQLPPEEFTAARDQFAKGLDDPGTKKAIKALRRPTASAYVVNQLVRDQPSAIENLVDLGEQMRAAMTGKGGDVRGLTEQRRELVSQLVDPDLPANVRDDVTATLEAATADPQLSAAVRSGRLVKPLRYAGFGEFPDLGDVLATPLPTKGAARSSRPKQKSAKVTAERGAKKTAAKAKPATPDLDGLRRRVLELSGAADDAQRRYDDASRAVTAARATLEAAEKERTAAHNAARVAHAAAEKARRELGRAERS
jgi:hypothetical protein